MTIFIAFFLFFSKVKNHEYSACFPPLQLIFLFKLQCLRDVVLWFGGFGMKLNMLDFVSVAISGEFGV